MFVLFGSRSGMDIECSIFGMDLDPNNVGMDIELAILGMNSASPTFLTLTGYASTYTGYDSTYTARMMRNRTRAYVTSKIGKNLVYSGACLPTRIYAQAQRAHPRYMRTYAHMRAYAHTRIACTCTLQRARGYAHIHTYDPKKGGLDEALFWGKICGFSAYFYNNFSLARNGWAAAVAAKET